jgi:predicted RNase H-like nuclease (RuvC/YqgF family)
MSGSHNKNYEETIRNLRKKIDELEEENQRLRRERPLKGKTCENMEEEEKKLNKKSLVIEFSSEDREGNPIDRVVRYERIDSILVGERVEIVNRQSQGDNYSNFGQGQGNIGKGGVYNDPGESRTNPARRY